MRLEQCVVVPVKTMERLKALEDENNEKSKIITGNIDYTKAQRYSPSYKIADYSKIFYVLKDRNSIARNRQFYTL